jgi:hypothetical protein
MTQFKEATIVLGITLVICSSLLLLAIICIKIFGVMSIWSVVVPIAIAFFVIWLLIGLGEL